MDRFSQLEFDEKRPERKRSQGEPIRDANYFHKKVGDPDAEEEQSSDSSQSAPVMSDTTEKEVEPKEQHLTFMENQRGVSYLDLFGSYLKDSKHITITDPYIRLFYQARNLMELLEVIEKQKLEDDEIVVSLITVEDEYKGDQQKDFGYHVDNQKVPGYLL